MLEESTGREPRSGRRLGNFVRRRAMHAACVAGLLILAVATNAFADIPDNGQVFHGCVSTGRSTLFGLLPGRQTGSLRVIDTSKGQRCNRDELSVMWNQTGPQGSSGPSGPSGPAGTGNAANDYVSGPFDPVNNQIGQVIPAGAWTQVATVALSIPGSANHQVLVMGQEGVYQRGGIINSSGSVIVYKVGVRVLMDGAVIDDPLFSQGYAVYDAVVTLPFSRVVPVSPGNHVFTVEVYQYVTLTPLIETAHSVSAIDLGAAPPAP